MCCSLGGAPVKAVLRLFASSFAKKFLPSGGVTLRSARPSKFTADGFRDVDGGVVKSSEIRWMGNVSDWISGVSRSRIEVVLSTTWADLLWCTRRGLNSGG